MSVVSEKRLVNSESYCDSPPLQLAFLRGELNDLVVEQPGTTQANRLYKQPSSFGNMLKKRMVRLFSSKNNLNASVNGDGPTQAKQKASKKTGSAPNLHHLGFIKGSQNRRTLVEIPSPGASISTIIGTPTRSKRSPRVVRRQTPGKRGDVRNSSASLSSLAHNRFNLVDFDFEIPDELLASQFNNSCTFGAMPNGHDNRRLTMTLSAAQLNSSVVSTPGTTPAGTPVWYPNACLPQQLSAYHLQVQSPVSLKARSAGEQFEFPPTPKQSTSNGTNSVSSGNDESTRTKQESSMSLASSGSVQIEDLSVQQLGEYLRRHNLERISVLCEQHAVDGPFFLDLTEADLCGYPFCASPFEAKCIRRLQKGIVPKCD